MNASLQGAEAVIRRAFDCEAALNAVPIYESAHAKLGEAYVVNGTLIMHPLDVIAIRTPAALERLDLAMEWILGGALWELDVVAAKL